MATISEFIDDFIKNIYSPSTQALVEISEDESILKECNDRLEAEINKLPADVRIVRTDVIENSSYGELLIDIINKIRADEKFDNKDIGGEQGLKVFNGLDPKSASRISSNLQTILKIFKSKKIKVVIVIEHYESSPERWVDGDYGDLRKIKTQNGNIELILSSSLPAQVVSQYPRGSSALHNIFSTFRDGVITRDE